MSTVTVNLQTWKVDLGDLADSIKLVGSKASSIGDEYDNITSQFHNLEWQGLGKTASAWASPAGDTFPPVATKLENAMSTVQQLLSDIVNRMQKTYDNYVQAETMNTKNLTPKP